VGSASQQNENITKTIIFVKNTPTLFSSLQPNHIMSRSYEEEEADIQRAILDAESIEKPVWTQIAILYNVPYQRLLARVNGRGDRFQNERHNKALSIKQEFALIRIINRMEFNKIYCRLSIISSVANFLLRKAYDDPDIDPSTISKLWITRFLTRKYSNAKQSFRY
jgi:hypothetical protein